MTKTETHTNKTLLRVIIAGVVLLLTAGVFCGAAAADDTTAKITYHENSTVDPHIQERIDTQEFTPGTMITLKPESGMNFNAGDRKFIGWAIGSRDATSYYTDQQSVQRDAGVDLYAQWGAVTGISSISGVYEIKSNGYYQLKNDVTGRITVSSGILAVIDLNGKTLDAKKEGCPISINGGLLTLVDSSSNGTGKITGGNSLPGGGVCVRDGGTFTMNSGTISGNKEDDHGGGVYVEAGMFTMNSGSITGNKVNIAGGGVYVHSGMFTMNGGTISENEAQIAFASATYGGGVYVDGYGKFTMNGGEIVGEGTGKGDIVATEGGGVYVGKNGTFEMNGGTITKCKADNNGGGVMVRGRGTFTMTGGSITENYASGYTEDKGIGKGGGVCVGFEDEGVANEEGTFTMYGGYIGRNEAYYKGGGVYVCVEGSTFTMKGGTIEGVGTETHDSMAKYGCGVYVNNRSTFTMEGGTIQNCMAGDDGGGVYVNGGSTFAMSGGSITKNFASGLSSYDGLGGGVYVGNGTFKMNGGSIDDNKGRGNGAGVYITSKGTFNVSGSPVINNNKYGSNLNNVWSTANDRIILTDKLKSDADIQIGNPLSGQFGVVASSYETPSPDDVQYFHNNDGTGTAILKTNGTLCWDDGTRYTVTYYSNGATGGAAPVDGTPYIDGGFVTVKLPPPEMVRTGFDFVCWNTQADGKGQDYAAGSTFYIRKSMTLYAKWVEKPKHDIRIKIDGHGKASSEPATAAAGTLVTLTATPNPGYLFKEWVVEAGDVTIDANNQFTMPEEDVSIYAYFTPIECTVTYDANSGTGDVPAEVTKPFGTEITVAAKPENLAKSGHEFTCWNTQADGKGQDYQVGSKLTIQKSMTLYANWRGLEEHDILVETDGHGTASSEPATAVKGTPVSLFVTPDTGYEFGSWKVLRGGISIDDNKFTMPDSDVEIEAHFTPIECTVTYYANGGSGDVPGKVIQPFGSLLTLPGKPDGLKRPGYTFTGWNTKSDGTGQDYEAGSTFTVRSDMDLYANWVKIPEYAIVVGTDGHGTVFSVPSQAAAGTTVQLFATPDAGYTFKEWKVEAGGITIDAKNQFTMPAKNVSITGYFTPIRCTVTYDANGGTGSVPDAETYDSGSSVFVKDNIGGLTKSGFRFTGWNSEKDGSGQDYAAGSSFTILSSLTLYANWVKEEMYDITILTDGHGTASSRPLAAAAGTLVTLTAKPDPGYKFGGWVVEAGDVTIDANNQFTMPEEDVSIYAYFTLIECTVTYDANGGSGDVPGKVIRPFGTEITVAAKPENLKKDGSRFTGWNTASDGTGIDYPPGSTFTITQNLTLFAEWTPNEYHSVTAVSIGHGTVTVSPGSAPKDTLISLTAEPESGYQFTRWFAEPETVEIRNNSFTMPDEDVYIYGVFEEKSEPTPIPHKSSSSQGSSTWLTETPTPTATATPTPTPASDVPTVKPVTQPTPSGATPVPLAGILAGLGCVAVIFGLRRK